MFQRRDVRTPEVMPVYSRFGATEKEVVPGGYLVPEDASGVLELLALHGIRTEAPVRVRRVQQFRLDSVRVAERPFQTVRPQEAFGQWAPVDNVRDPGIPQGAVWVPMDQPLARLAFALLEPRSDDGVVYWAVLDLSGERTYPILRAWPE